MNGEFGLRKRSKGNSIQLSVIGDPSMASILLQRGQGPQPNGVTAPNY